MTDIAIERLTHIKSVKHQEGTDPAEQIFGVKAVNVQIGSTVKEAASDGDPGITAQDITFNEITLSLEFESSAPLIPLIARAEGNLTVTFGQSAGGKDRVRTFKNVRFRGVGGNSSNSQDANYENLSIQAKCTWGAEDTLATMITEVDAT